MHPLVPEESRTYTIDSRIRKCMKDERLASLHLGDSSVEGSIAFEHKRLFIGHGLTALFAVLHPDLCRSNDEAAISCCDADLPVQLCSCGFPTHLARYELNASW